MKRGSGRKAGVRESSSEVIAGALKINRHRMDSGFFGTEFVHLLMCNFLQKRMPSQAIECNLHLSCKSGNK